MQIVMCDDEQIYLDTITQYIETWAMANGHLSSIVIRSFLSSEDLYEEWEKGMPIDMLIIDIQIPGEMSGLQVAKQIFSQNEYIPIVFMTNYAEYACEGYQVNALRYIRKPVTQTTMNDCMNIVWKQWSLQQGQTITVETPVQAIRLPINMIIYLESARHTVHLVTADQIGEYDARITMDAFLKKLPCNMFVQCHRCYIVNLMYVRQFKRTFVTLANGQEIPIGRSYAKNFAYQFRQYYQGADAV